MTLLRRFALLGILCLAVQAHPLQLDARDDWTTQQWDAIIVGAGTAGIIVADRLSEAGKKTLLLEQGGPSYGITGGTERPSWLNGTNLSRVDVPGLYSSIFSGSSSLLCTSQVRAFQACTIGGNSAINAGLYFQPPASDWDTYHPSGWKSTDVQPAISKLLSRQPSVTTYSQDGKYYLESGYQAAYNWLVKGAGYANISINGQPNSKTKVFGRTVWDYHNGQRGGPVTTYLQSSLKRSNFLLHSGVRVQYVTRNANNTATGILATVNNQNTTIKLAPKGRVILSAGALQSPQILMYSGIGPADQLSNLAKANRLPPNTTQVVNSAVGDGLFDNPNTFVELSTPSVKAYTYSYSSPIAADASAYLKSRSGPYSFAGQTSAFWTYINHPDGTKTGVQGTVGSSGYQDFTNSSTFTVNIYGTSGMLSKGRVVLSTDGKFTPGPDGNVYYSDKNSQDANSIATFIYDIFQSLPKAGITPLNIPQNSTLAQIQKYITTSSPYARGSVQHWSSSCRIGPCVDAQTRVVGVSNLHVIDASILSPLTVNPQFGVMTAAEHGSALILALDK